MAIKHVLSTIITIGLFTACTNSDSTEKAIIKKIDYSNQFVIDSLIKVIPYSNDTMFLGFTAGMTLSDYQQHIQTLKNNGKVITFKSSNVVSTIAGSIDVGAGYTFSTKISSEKSGKPIAGKGDYFLEPHFNKKGNLISLYILPIEKWDSYYGGSSPNWLKDNISDNSNELCDKDLWRALIDNSIVDGQGFVRQKGGLVIYESNLTINYIDLKSLLIELLEKITEKEAVNDTIKNIKF